MMVIGLENLKSHLILLGIKQVQKLGISILTEEIVKLMKDQFGLQFN